MNPSTVALSSDPLVNDLALNSAYTVLYALYETRHESDGGFRYAALPDNEVIAIVREEMDIPDEDFISAQLPTLHGSIRASNRAPERILSSSSRKALVPNLSAHWADCR